MPHDPVAVRAEIAAAEAERKRNQLRHDIATAAGDLPSQLGTTDDTAALGVLGLSALTVALSGASDFDEFKSAFLGHLGALAGPNDLVQISTDLLAHIADGSVQLPVLVKNLATVWAEIEQRGTAKSAELIKAGLAG